ncbi:MAG: hypothetical protein HQL90_07455 [Magnetococcales bacterium]|nr:hypothetical protein [Magnetococcales bacterium]
MLNINVDSGTFLRQLQKTCEGLDHRFGHSSARVLDSRFRGNDEFSKRYPPPSCPRRRASREMRGPNDDQGSCESFIDINRTGDAAALTEHEEEEFDTEQKDEPQEHCLGDQLGDGEWP